MVAIATVVDRRQI